MGWGYETDWTTLAAEKPRDNYVELAAREDSASLAGTPDGMGVRDEQNLATRGSSTTEEDAARAVAFAKHTAETMIAQGCSNDEVRQAVANLCINPDHMQAALAAADQQIEANSYSLGAGARNNEQGQDQGTQFLASTMSGLLVGSDKSQNMCLAPGVQGGDTISLAALGNLAPLQTPNLAQERERGFGLA